MVTSVTGLTLAKLTEIEQSPIVDCNLIDDILYLYKKDGTEFNVGSVRGAQGTGGIAPILYSAYSSTAQAIATNSVVAVTSWTFREGTSSLITYATTNFTITQAGLYMVNFQATFGSGIVGRRVAMIYKNGAEARRCDVGAIGAVTSPFVTHCMSLIVGDIITFRVYHTQGAAININGSQGQRINILKIV